MFGIEPDSLTEGNLATIPNGKEIKLSGSIEVLKFFYCIYWSTGSNF